MADLLPCPFCGAAPFVTEDNTYGDCIIECHCEHEPSVLCSKHELDDAKAIWNRRAPASPAPAKESATQQLETEAMQDAARGILQILRGKPGCTEHDVFLHCKMRGDSTEGLHENDGSYVTEARAAAMIYRAMVRARIAREGKA